MGPNLSKVAFQISKSREIEALLKFRTGNETADDPKFFLGTFDLNAWYQAQMPANVELEPSTQCSYFSICSLDETLFCEEHETGNLLDCRIDLNSVSRYVNI